MKIDALDFAIYIVLSQMGAHDKFHLVAFYLKKFLAIEINYQIHDKELLTIVD